MKLAEQEHVASALRRWLKGHNLRRISRLTGISKSMLYAYMGNELPIPAWVLARLHLALPDLGCFAAAIGAPELGLALSELPPADQASGVHRSALKVGVAAGALQSTTLKAMEDGKIDDAEARAIAQQIESLERVAETLKRAARPTRSKLVGQQ